jgi:hypothetical protein
MKEPKLLSGLTKRYVVGYPCREWGYVVIKTTGEKAGPNPVV